MRVMKRVARTIAADVAMVLACMTLMLGSLIVAPRAHGAENEFHWKHFGVDPFAKTRDEAVAARERVFREAFGFSNACVSAAMQATSGAPNATGHLNVGDKLAVMVSSRYVAHHSTVVDFAPVRKGIDYAATVEIWEFDCDGQHKKVGLPEICNNWSLYFVPVAPAPPTPPAKKNAAPPAVRVTGCPDGRILITDAWLLHLLPADLRTKAEELIAAAKIRESNNATLLEPYKPDAVSRTVGGPTRRAVKVRAPITADVYVRLLDPKTAEVVQDLGVIHLVASVGGITLTEEQHLKVVETLWPEDFSSPVVSGGFRRLRLFPEEWKDECRMHVHGFKP